MATIGRTLSLAAKFYFLVMTGNYLLGVQLDSTHPYGHLCYGQLTAVKKGIR